VPNNFDKVIAALRFLELRPNIQSYRWRFLIQKTVYLAQALGLPTDYVFTIYVAGPYSPQLACDYFAQANKIGSLETNYDLNPEDMACLSKMKACCDLYKDLSLMECTSTVVYLMKDSSGITDDELFTCIRSLKPYLSDSTCVIGINKAKELLFRPEFLTDELRDEIEKWDKAED
jgi:hypothetical protein